MFRFEVFICLFMVQAFEVLGFDPAMLCGFRILGFLGLRVLGS